MQIHLPSNNNSKLGMGCMTLFLLPFAGMGLLAMGHGLRDVLAGKPGGWLQVLFGGVFVGFAGLMFGLMLRGRKKLQELAARREQFAAEPWKVNPDWAAGRVPDNNRRAVWFFWFFALAWNAISFPIAILVGFKEIARHNWPALLTFLFPLIGLALLWAAISQTLRYVRFGRSVLDLVTIPGVLGGQLVGIVSTSKRVPAADGFHLELRCVRSVVTGSGDDQSTHETVLWEERAHLAHGAAEEDPTRSAIPVSFTIPYTCQATDDANPRDRVLWRLTVHAKTPGPDYKAMFEVPVFKTAESREDFAPAVDPLAAYRVAEPPVTGLTTRGLLLSPLPGGGVELTTAAFRNPGSVLFGLLLGSGITAGLVLGAMHGSWTAWPFILIGGFIALIVWGLTLAGMLVSSTLRCEPAELTLTRHVLGMTVHTLRVPAAEVERITPEITMQAGNKCYYGLKIYRPGVKLGSIVGTGMAEKREAEWLAKELLRGLGRE